jgi:hypothetical protein
MVATSANFVVVDNSASFYSGVFSDFSRTKVTLLTKIEDCSGAVSDLASFFNFRFLNSTGKPPSVIPLSSQAKTSLIVPLSLSGTNESLYFFHNPDDAGDPVRISSSNLLPQTFYANVKSGPRENVSIFCDRMPRPGNDTEFDFSLFTVIRRVLITLSSSGPGPPFLRFLVPESWADTNSARWINSTAVFEHAVIRLYDDRWEGPNFVTIGNRSFVFGHALDDATFQTLGLHMATNSHEVLGGLTRFWESIWANATEYGAG